jgi:hypothetical protein
MDGSKTRGARPWSLRDWIGRAGGATASSTGKRRIPIGRLAGLMAIVVGGFVVARGAQSPHFRTLRPGVEFGTIHGEPFCRFGSPQIAVLRLDPKRAHLRVRHYSRLEERRPLTIVQWQERFGALAVFNAGQYYPDYSYMGLLVSEGVPISPKLHPSYQAALVAAPVGAGAGARVLDLTRRPLDPKRPGWREVAQSFMLFDTAGTLRIRKSNQVAKRTVVAEDQQGRLLAITSEGGYTLHEFGKLLLASPLKLSHAMSMDGGDEAELCVRSGGFRYASFGPWKDGVPDAPGAQVPLPAVIAVSVE